MFGAVFETLKKPDSPAKLAGIVLRFSKRGKGSSNKRKMKRTEIIIETQRVTVIRRRRQSGEGPYDGSLAHAQIIDVGDGNHPHSTTDEIGSHRIQGEEKDPCTDSRNR
jgi:hypothetical protein